MCGIFGIVSLSDPIQVNESNIQRALETMKHRGPDERGHYIHNTPKVTVGLGHCRLSIIDLQSGQQPLFNEDKSVAIVFNGEIYNFLELKQELEKRGHQFSTRTDTEVIVHLYEEFGEKCLQKLRGMFAFGIWDKNKQKLFLARDRIGKKPLFYFQGEDKVLFASEMKALLVDGAIKKTIDPFAIDDYLSFLYIPSPRTIFKEIRKLPPAHYMVVQCANSPNNQIEIKGPSEYWDVEFKPEGTLSESEWAERLDGLFRECVAIRLISDVPLGAFLSGGVDSSAVVAYMAELLKNPVITNAIGFRERAFNELEYARIIGTKFSTDHHEYFVKPDAMSILEKLAWHFDEPFADSSAIPTYYVSQMAKKNVTVALSGDGGDEIFAGYIRRYSLSRLENIWREVIPLFFRRYMIGPISRVYPKGDYLPRWMRAKYMLMNLPLSPVEAYFRDMSCFLPEEKEKLYQKDFRRSLNGYSPMNHFKSFLGNSEIEDHLSRIQYIDFKTYLPEDILVKVDRMSMANSLEVRSPLLDHKFIEFVATIPSNLKLNGKTSKYIFKRTLENRLPDAILYRGKQGFSIPVESWLKNELREYAEDILFSDKAKQRDYFDYDYVKKIWNHHLKGLRDHSDQLWTLLMLELWHRSFMDHHG
jgi:asparagine synthase (glutamine-hydrolysing)